MERVLPEWESTAVSPQFLISTNLTPETPEPEDASVVVFTTDLAWAYAYRRHGSVWRTTSSVLDLSWDEVTDALAGLQVFIIGPGHSPETFKAWNSLTPVEPIL